MIFEDTFIFVDLDFALLFEQKYILFLRHSLDTQTGFLPVYSKLISSTFYGNCESGYSDGKINFAANEFHPQ